MGQVGNVHEREIPVPAATLGSMISALGGERDGLWPTPAWPPMRLDGPLSVGADGGHGPIRYWVSDYEPGRRLRFTFRPETGIDGFHELAVLPLAADRSVLRHVARGVMTGSMRILWPLVVRPVHDAMVEDLLDNAERAATGGVAQPARWSRWVRLLRRWEVPRPVSIPIPQDAQLARGALDGAYLGDAFSLETWPGVSSDPQEWADEIFKSPPRWVHALLLLREGLVGLIGIERAGRAAFNTCTARSGEVLLGTDGNHLDFRVSILVGAESVTLSTVVRLHNRRGRLYWAVVRRLHPFVVRAMLRRAGRAMVERAWAGRAHVEPAAPA